MSTSGSMEDLGAIVIRLSKELELMGLPGLASQQQVDYNDGAIAVDVISDLISASYDLIGLLRDLQRSKRQREDHAQQLLHDLQRSQWLLDKEKELTVQREREAAEACEKERQANVRLQLAETLLKKKTEENRQLVHECQLKENQWLHALRRRDQENHRLQQQLLKFLHSKSSGSGSGGIIPHQVEIRGSLAARASSSDSTRLRKQWDRTADETRKHAEVMWKTALNSLEKDHQLLRVDYLQLVDTLGRFLTNCADTLGGRRPANNIFFNVVEWIRLPVSSMRDRLEEALHLVECALVTSTVSQSGQNFNTTDRRDEIEINAVTDQSEHVASGEHRPTAIHNRIGPLVKDDVIISKSRTISTLSPTHENPMQMAKCVRPEPVSTGQFDSRALRKPSKGSTQPPAAINQVDWNQLKMDSPALSPLSSRQDTVTLGQPTIGTEASFLVGSRETDDRVDVIHDEMATLDTPCPSASNSPSRSSTSSDSSWKSQRSEIDATTEIDEQFYRTCDAAATLVRNGRRPSNDASICAQKSGTTVNLNSGYGGTITAKVSVVQQRQATRRVAPATSIYSANPS
ncbi:uncharacterized protein LOC130691223 [Daphnia carinata]|uniref:uncharacterized protein LOC130691223 n=1 Tax=Daphnia carinata TaxID=120202 RepID=UPI00258115A8|nr:uncharacterized protein LOC130691223 [Daphnia carinata]